jgi:MoaA/NifB/PqqE/SkfB family radical SAM enzyme
MIRNYNTLVGQIEALSEEMMEDMAPIDWYRTLKQHEEETLQRIQHGIIPPFFCAPLGVQLELTYKCNLNCIHCYNNSGKREAPACGARNDVELSDHEWISLAKELASLNIFECIISGGEPLLRENLVFEILDILSEHGVTFLFLTNGWLVDERVIERLLHYRFHYIQVSIDGADSETHDRVRQRDGSWKRAVRAATLIKEAGLPLCIASTLVSHSSHQLPDVIDLAANIGANQIIVDKFMSTGAAALNRNELLLPDGWRKQYYDIMLRKREQYKGRIQILSSMDPVIQLRMDIASPTKVALVRPNGDVKLDCITPFCFGNVRKELLKKIWETGMCKGWQRSEIIEFVKTITKDEDLAHNDRFPVPHVQKNWDIDADLEI